MSERLLRASLWLACTLNLLVAVVFAAPASPPGQLVGLPASVSPIYALMVALFVALFGCVYGWLAWRPCIDRALLTLGSIGKTCAFLLATGLWFAGEAEGLLLVAALGDLALAMLWVAWLRGNAMPAS